MFTSEALPSASSKSVFQAQVHASFAVRVLYWSLALVVEPVVFCAQVACHAFVESTARSMEALTSRQAVFSVETDCTAFHAEPSQRRKLTFVQLVYDECVQAKRIHISPLPSTAKQARMPLPTRLVIELSDTGVPTIDQVAPASVDL